MTEKDKEFISLILEQLEEANKVLQVYYTEASHFGKFGKGTISLPNIETIKEMAESNHKMKKLADASMMVGAVQHNLRLLS